MIIPRDPADELLAAISPNRPKPPPVAPRSLTSFVNIEPADSTFANGQFKFWLDATPGNTKLMIKAKDSAGVVRRGQVALT